VAPVPVRLATYASAAASFVQLYATAEPGVAAPLIAAPDAGAVAFADAVPVSAHSTELQPAALAAGAYRPAFAQEAGVVLVLVAPAFSLHPRQKVLWAHAHPAGDLPAL